MLKSYFRGYNIKGYIVFLTVFQVQEKSTLYGVPILVLQYLRNCNFKPQYFSKTSYQIISFYTNFNLEICIERFWLNTWQIGIAIPHSLGG